MRFRTEIKLSSSDLKISHNDAIFMMGSCFTTYIGQKFFKNKFFLSVNPFGTLYHPNPIKNNLKAAIEDLHVNEALITSIESRFVHYLCHSTISAHSKSELIQEIRQKNLEVKSFTSQARYIFITLGTAFHFYHKELQLIAGNCHKQPERNFERRLSTIEELNHDLQEIVNLLFNHNPSSHIIFTVSPVRHIRDGLIANNRSKSHLVAAVHNMVEKNPKVSYFPSFEFIVDDLRDYRFYAEDLIHPNNQAVDYIWNKLKDYYFSKDTQNIIQRIRKIQTSLNHRPFDLKSESYKTLLLKLKDDLARLEHDENINVSFEYERLNKLLEELQG